MTRRRKHITQRRRLIIDKPLAPTAKPGDEVSIGGVPVTVVTDEEAETAGAVICMVLTHPLLHPDNLTGPCAWACGRTVQWRPSSPSKPPRMCMPCFLASETTTAH